MRKEKKFITVNELKPGMIMAEDVLNNNIVLIGAGMVISDAVIEKLKEVYIFGRVAIYVDEEDGNKDDYIQTEKSVQQIEEQFTQLSTDMEKIFRNDYYNGINDIEEIRQFAKVIQDELDSPGAVIKNIVLNGSGTDRIYRHSVNVAALSNMLGKWLGLKNNELVLLTYAGILHDFGKTKIDEAILRKPTALTKEELQTIKDHPVIAYNYIKKIPFLDQSVSIGVLMHHERNDGSGYPLRLTAEKIHAFSKILAIADVFDAVNSDRIYKPSSGPFEALEIIQKESLGKLDFQYCKIFLDHIINYYMGENVLINTGKVCKIIQVNRNDFCRPLLFDGNDFLDLRQNGNIFVKRLMV